VGNEILMVFGGDGSKRAGGKKEEGESYIRSPNFAVAAFVGARKKNWEMEKKGGKKGWRNLVFCADFV